MTRGRAWIVLMLLSTTAALAAQPTPRSQRVVDAFKRLSGYPSGRPGFVVDHRIPLCAGGPDTITNMQWEPVVESYTKDTYERRLCKELVRQGYTLARLPVVPQ